MTPVLLLDIERPALAAALVRRGLFAVAESAGRPAAALVASRSARPPCPVLVEAACAAGAGALLDAGADDVVLASDPDALVAARLAALIRRAQAAPIVVGPLRIDTVERRVTQGGAVVALLPREYLLLLHLARQAGSIVSAAELHRAVWARAFDPGTNVIAVHLSRIRRRLGGGVAIVTERGRGYRLAAPIAGAAVAG